MKSYSDSYKAAGVDVTAGYESVELMKKHVKRTMIPGVVSGIGGFGGLFQPELSGMKEPVLVSGTDGVGTKLKVAMLLDKHDTIGIDAVAMCVNDVVCCGAKPLFFLDYIACGKNFPEKIAQIVAGVAEGCVQSGCALIGGETAEHPGMMPEEDYDLAGFTVGIVDKEKIIDGSRLEAGDVLLGVKSSGVHSNGFSLVRKVFGIGADDEANKEILAKHYEGLSATLGETLLTPTRIYVKSALAAIAAADVKAISHITGGGFYENIPRMLKEGLTAKIEKAAVPVLPIFDLIQKTGNIPERDMFNTFNMGVGLCVAVSKETAQKAMDAFREAGEEALVLGEVTQGDEGGCAVLNIGVMVSGGGTNLQKLIDAQGAGQIENGQLRVVISSRPDAYALERAKQAGIEAITLRRKDYDSVETYSQALIDALRERQVDLVVLAGFLTITGDNFVEAFRNRIINVHPALLPSFGGKGYYGLHVHEAVLARGVKVTGATVHFVNEVCDGGPIILQKAVDVKEGDTPEILQKRVMEEAEWILLPQAVSLFCQGKLSVKDGVVHIAE